MNTSHPSSPIDPAAPQTVARPTRTRRVLRGLLFCVCLAASLVALFFAVENWRGRKAWQEYRKEATARGVVLDYKDLIPPPIPDADNFAMTPFFTALFDFEPGTQKLRDPVKTRDGWSFLPEFLKEIPRDDQEKLRSVVSEQRQKRMNGDWQKARPRDFVAIYLLHQLDKDDQARSAADFKPEDLDAKQAASAFLDNYRIFEDLFEELRSAARRTGSRYPIRYEEENPAGILLPHLAVLKSLTQVLSYRASASLVAGKSDQALADVALAMRLSDSLTTERTLIAYLVRIAMINLVVQPAWEGLADRRWTDAQLVQLMEIFGRPKPFAEMKYALDGERGFGNALIELMRRRPELYEQVFGAPEGGGAAPAMSLLRLMPGGWFQLEQVNYNRLMDTMYQLDSEIATPGFDPVEFANRVEKLEKASRSGSLDGSRHGFFARTLFPALSRVRVNASRVAASLAMLRTSCALERHHLSRGVYPESLEVLAPTQIQEVPGDPVKGGALAYERLEKGRYRLRSVQLEVGKKRDEGAEPASSTHWEWSFPLPQ